MNMVSAILALMQIATVHVPPKYCIGIEPGTWYYLPTVTNRKLRSELASGRNITGVAVGIDTMARPASQNRWAIPGCFVDYFRFTE